MASAFRGGNLGAMTQPVPPATLAALLDAVIPLAWAAGTAILAVRAKGCEAMTKADASPVTEADHASEAILLPGLRRLLPDAEVISEERVAAGEIPAPGERFWLVDPLDGTREFLNGDDDFCVCIALVAEGRPVLGIIHAPARGQSWAGVVGTGAWLVTPDGRRPIAARAAGKTTVALVSRSHRDPDTDALLARMGVTERMVTGAATKFGMLAEGRADLYPRLVRISEWDIAAGDAIVTAAGGTMTDMDGQPIRYGNAAERFRASTFLARGRS